MIKRYMSTTALVAFAAGTLLANVAMAQTAPASGSPATDPAASHGGGAPAPISTPTINNGATGLSQGMPNGVPRNNGMSDAGTPNSNPSNSTTSGTRIPGNTTTAGTAGTTGTSTMPAAVPSGSGIVSRNNAMSDAGTPNSNPSNSTTSGTFIPGNTTTGGNAGMTGMTGTTTQTTTTVISPSPMAQSGVTTGARPGNVIGTGNSLPMSSRASNTTPSNTQGTVAPRLPTPSVGEDASVRSYLTAARDALAANRTGMAQEALERAETRALDRSVLASNVSNADQSGLVSQIHAARTALGNGDRSGASQAIAGAMNSSAVASMP